jgi:hypothetical protein
MRQTGVAHYPKAVRHARTQADRTARRSSLPRAGARKRALAPAQHERERPCRCPPGRHRRAALAGVREVTPDDHAAGLKLWSERHHDLGRARTRSPTGCTRAQIGSCWRKLSSATSSPCLDQRQAQPESYPLPTGTWGTAGPSAVACSSSVARFGLFSGVCDRLAGLLVPLGGSELFRLYPGLSRSVVCIRVSKIS